MTFRVKALAGIALAAATVVASSASPAVVKYYFTGGASDGHGNFDVFDPITYDDGTLPSKHLTEPAHCTTTCTTYDFIFQLIHITPGATASIELGAQTINVVGRTHTSVAEPIQFDLFKGSPGTTPSVANHTNPNWLGHSDDTVPTSPIFGADLVNGLYYVQILPSYVVVSGEASSGSLIETPVPEPASWSLMILGVGSLGATLRRKRVAAVAG
jgi:hypothetical protein